jgi:hypothetical protein
LEITANDSRPLDNVLGALEHQHRWHINYEDPQYGEADIVDDTAPSWLQQHPNSPRVYAVAGGDFYAKIAVDGYFPDDPIQILPALVEAYNHSGNPGRFELRSMNHESFDIVPTAAADGPQKPILDTVMSFDLTAATGAYPSLEAFCEELSRRSGPPVEFWGCGGMASNLLMQSRIKLHSQNQPAREVLRQMLSQVSPSVSWRVLYDPGNRNFLLFLR